MYFRPVHEDGDEDTCMDFSLMNRRNWSFPFQVKTGEEKSWDIIADKFPPTIEELQAETAQEEAAQEEEYDDEYSLAFEYLFNEQPQSEASKFCGWQQAAEDVTNLRTFRASSPLAAATEPIPPVFKKTWGRKKDGRVVEKIVDPPETQLRAASDDKVIIDVSDLDDLPPLPPCDDIPGLMPTILTTLF